MMSLFPKWSFWGLQEWPKWPHWPCATWTICGIARFDCCFHWIWLSQVGRTLKKVTMSMVAIETHCMTLVARSSTHLGNIPNMPFTRCQAWNNMGPLLRGQQHQKCNKIGCWPRIWLDLFGFHRPLLHAEWWSFQQSTMSYVILQEKSFSISKWRPNKNALHPS